MTSADASWPLALRQGDLRVTFSGPSQAVSRDRRHQRFHLHSSAVRFLPSGRCLRLPSCRHSLVACPGASHRLYENGSVRADSINRRSPRSPQAFHGGPARTDRSGSSRHHALCAGARGFSQDPTVSGRSPDRQLSTGVPGAGRTVAPVQRASCSGRGRADFPPIGDTVTALRVHVGKTRQ